MNLILAVAGFVVIGASVVAVSARDGRAVVLAIAIALVGTPIIADPTPSPVSLAASFVGSILAAYLLWVAVRERPADGAASPVTGGSRIGWPAEFLVAVAACIVGFFAHGLGAPAIGPVTASAVGFSVAALAVLPTLTGRDIVRVGVGLFLLLDAALLVRTALGGTPGPLETLLSAGLIATLGATVAAVAIAARLDGQSGFALVADGRSGSRREPDAHRAEPG